MLLSVVVNLAEITDPSATIVDKSDERVHISAAFSTPHNCSVIEVR